MTENQITILNALKGGAIAGIIGVAANNLWSLIANAMGSTIPPGFVLAITMSSLIPVLIGSVIYFLIVKFLSKGKIIWALLAVVFTVISFYPVFTTSQLPDGTLLDATFPLLAAPMHVISGFLAVWGIPRWSR